MRFILVLAINLYELILFVRIIMSWMPGALESRFGTIMVAITEPVLIPCRALLRMIFKSMGRNYDGLTIDFSPIVAFLLIGLLERILF